MTCPDDNAFGLLLDGALDDAERARLEAHLDACGACARIVHELAVAVPPIALPERYRLIGRLGAGAMGVVWEAEDTTLARRVAVKLIRAEVAGDPAYRGRMLREARALAQIRHPSVIAVHDLGDAGDELFLTLELVRGVDARAWRTAAARTHDAILGVWTQVADGLAAVHRAGIVHRDLKPENVLVGAGDRAVIADFGLSTGLVADGPSALTATGQIVGTPLYMALEQLRGDPATAKSDQFAWCVCTWEALTGARPFPSRGSIAAQAVAMLERPTAQGHVQTVLARGLDPDPAERWADLDQLLDALAERPRSWRWPWRR